MSRKFTGQLTLRELDFWQIDLEAPHQFLVTLIWDSLKASKLISQSLISPVQLILPTATRLTSSEQIS